MSVLPNKESIAGENRHVGFAGRVRCEPRTILTIGNVELIPMKIWSRSAISTTLAIKVFTSLGLYGFVSGSD